MTPGASSLAAAVSGLTRSDPRSPGITRERSEEGFRYRDPSGAEVTQREARQRIGTLAIPPAWTNVWISPDPLGHLQAGSRPASRQPFPYLAVLGVPDALRHHFEKGPRRLGVAHGEVAEAPFGEHQAVQLRLSGDLRRAVTVGLVD
jgi:hypothetical protein